MTQPIQPLARRSYTEPNDVISFGRMDKLCPRCLAKHWVNERTKRKKSSPTYGPCCHTGKVHLDFLPDPPHALRDLYTGDSPQSKDFRLHIRQYNCALAFASFMANEKDVNSRGRGPWVYKIGYMLYHSSSSLLPLNGQEPRYAQLYFYDPNDALTHRMHRNPNLRSDTMQILQNILLETNEYSQIFLHASEILQTTPARDLAICFVADPSTDERRYNPPTADELAAIIPGDEMAVTRPRDILLHSRTGGVQHISDLHCSYCPLHYVLLFPYGTSGWTISLQHQPQLYEGDCDNARTHMSQLQFYAFRLYTHQNEFPIIHYGGRLFQQYLCDIWVSTDQNRLRYVENNQSTLRATLYSGLEDAVACSDDNLNLHDVGHRVILPSTYIGGPRYMNQCFQDAMALARYYHGFDLFITFTTNPSWPEINQELFPNQTPSDRPDLIARVFNMYKSSLLHDLTKLKVFGDVQGHVYTIEFQKRGLPHMHLLLGLFPQFHPITPEDVHTIIRATWPHPQNEPRLFQIVKHSMVHGPCGPNNPNAPCMRNGECMKRFPKPFQAETVMTKDGYPIYARPDDGLSYPVRGVLTDNRWIVPYNPYLLYK
jgi:Helitron helicase-like domain at N-terminus